MTNSLTTSDVHNDLRSDDHCFIVQSMTFWSNFCHSDMPWFAYCLRNNDVMMTSIAGRH